MNQILIIFLTIFVSCSLAQVQNKACQKGGQYCQNHWDCCSNTCLSFLYKCSHIDSTDITVPQSSLAFASPVLDSRFDTPAQLIPPSSHEIISYDSLLEIIFNPLKLEQAAVGRDLNSISSSLGEDADEEVLKKEEKVITTTPDSPLQKEHEVITTKPDTPIKRDEEDIITTTDLPLNKEEEVIIKTTNSPQCLEIGSKCYLNEMCCTKRCHGYLHQCVT